MSDWHGFPGSLDPTTRALYPETRYPMPSCQPFLSLIDGEGVSRYPRPLTRWTCQECGAVWQFEVTTTNCMWRVIALPDPKAAPDA